ncbi:hypothetical protein B4N82_02555 [Acinetobacter baumannii]|jgi:hypothetical protein|nr:hypothetical protein B4N82_02555 [Acinetobacter baumannii]PIL58759.1 hypothetical protein B4N88_01140 [Acinetobacter baumannii]PIL60796.1 hypothetical protein B4N87_00485 [Acinetobacter baumannii]PIL64539.1 hypothetical protein B4N86_00065 [Acinetobacter baumannii]PIL68161.1 hypothetical protein B4O93_00910 [Acinetobacter baumannii]
MNSFSSNYNYRAENFFKFKKNKVEGMTLEKLKESVVLRSKLLAKSDKYAQKEADLFLSRLLSVF